LSSRLNIRISASPNHIVADGHSTSRIIVEVVDRIGRSFPAPRNIEVSLKTNLGQLRDNTITIAQRSNQAETSLISSTQEGVARVEARFRSFSGPTRLRVSFFTVGTNVEFLPRDERINFSIDLSAVPNQIAADGESTSRIRFELIDEDGNTIPAPVDFPVKLTTTLGTLEGDSIIIPAGRSLAWTTLTASNQPGKATVIATYGRGQDKSSINVYFNTPQERPNVSIKLSAAPNQIVADGESTSKILVELVDENDRPIPAPVAYQVTLTTTIGKLSSDSLGIRVGAHAVQTTLTSNRSETGVTVVEAKWTGGNESYSTSVKFVPPPRFDGKLKVTANPSEIPANGSSTSRIFIEVTDRNDTKTRAPIDILVGAHTSLGTLNEDIQKIPKDNQSVEFILTSSNEPGTAEIQLSWEGGEETYRTRVKFTQEEVTITGKKLVSGKIVQPNENPIRGATIQAVYKKLRREDDIILGITKSDEDGNYEINYISDEDVRADLVVQVLDQNNNVIANSPLILEAIDGQKVDLIIDHDAYPDLSEYEQLRKRVEPFLGDVTFDELDADSVALLAGKTNTNPINIAHFIQAKRLDSETNVSAEAYYAMFRGNLPVNLPVLVAQDNQLIKSSMEKAVSTNIVSQRVSKQIDEVVTAFNNKKVEHLLKQPELPHGEMSLNSFLDVAGLNSRQKRMFANLYSKHTGNSLDFWNTLQERDIFDAETVKSLQLSMQLGMLTLNNAPLIDTLHKRLRRRRREKSLRGLVDMTEAQWIRIIRQNKDEDGNVILPKNLPISEDQEPEVNYARTMMRIVEDAYPTLTLNTQLKRGDFVTAEVIKTFLNQNPDFEFRNKRVWKYFHDHNIDPPAELKSTLESVKRIFDITPRFEKYSAMQPLLKDGIDSAYAIRMMGKNRFLEKSAHLKLSPEQASYVWKAAYHKVTMTTSVFTAYTSLLNNIGLYVLPKMDLKELYSEYSINPPTWEELFGSLDFCTCKHCRSVYGPTAYLVDLLAFLREQEKDGKTALEVFFERRGDIGAIELNCHNTNTPIPYIDLVNEVLEHYIANAESYPSTKWWQEDDVPQTEGEAEDLRVHPEHLLMKAYQHLEETDYPWTLPFSLDLEEARAYLEPLNVKREDLIRSFNTHAKDDLTEEDKNAITAEHLGLTQREREIILGKTATGMDSWDETSITDISKVEVLMEKGSLTYQDLQRLLDTTFVNNDGDLKVDFGEQICDLTQARIPALQTEDLEDIEEHLNNIQRFMRLKRRIGWTIHELDATLRAFSLNDIDEEFLRKLSIIKSFQDELGTPLQTMLSWWSNINTVRYKDDNDEVQSSLYDDLFLNRTIGDDEDLQIFELNSERDQLANTSETINNYQSSILAALQLVSAEDLALIRTKREKYLQNDKLTLEHLSELYRVASFARALKLSVKDFLYLVDLVDSDPFDSTDIEATLEYVQTLEVIRESGFRIPELSYLLYHDVEENSRFLPSNEETSIFLLELRRGLVLVEQEYRYNPDPTGEQTAHFLSQVLSKDNLSVAMGPLLSSSTIYNL
jgi:hypothetical protein